jgi:paraquat-inducible protein B
VLNESQLLISELRQTLAPMLREWTQLATDSQTLVQQLDTGLGTTVKRVDQVLVSGTTALQQVQQSAASVDAVIGERSPVMTELTQTLEELAAAARAIRIMAEYLERHPEALWRGKQ